MNESGNNKKVTVSCTATIGCNIEIKYGDRWTMENDATTAINDMLQKLGIDGCALELHIDAAYDENDVEVEVP
ncbi:MAG: hypothetical protein HDQ88_11015 [Clostridia bacterium]|nr:hypothetical protein [Clostridia bacterium]